MPKIIYNKFGKNEISSLPVVQYNGKIIVILTPGETEKAVNYLLTKSILGFDTETRPSFKKGELHNVALLQVATEQECFLFRLNHTGLTPAIIRLLEDKTVTKVALSWHDDLMGLHKRSDFTTGIFIDIQQHVHDIGIEDMSLRKIYANLFGEKISKRQQLSNWEADILNDSQKRYAAIDAWACIKIYREIIRLKNTKDYKLIIKEENYEYQTSISETR